MNAGKMPVSPEVQVVLGRGSLGTEMWEEHQSLRGLAKSHLMISWLNLGRFLG